MLRKACEGGCAAGFVFFRSCLWEKLTVFLWAPNLNRICFVFPPLCPWWSLALAFCSWELWIKRRILNGEITARRQTQLAFKWHFFPKRLKAGNKQVGQLWVSVNVLTASRGVNQRRAGAPLGASSRGLRLRRASNLNSCCLIYMTQILLFLSLMLRGLQTFPDCFETRCSRFVNIPVRSWVRLWTICCYFLLLCCFSGCNSSCSTEVWQWIKLRYCAKFTDVLIIIKWQDAQALFSKSS